jgi:hypothetical protein
MIKFWDVLLYVIKDNLLYMLPLLQLQILLNIKNKWIL